MSRVELLRGAARRQAGAHAGSKLLSARAHGRFSGSHLSGRACLKKGAARDYLDDVALKGLQLAERDVERGALDEENLKSIKETVKEIMDDLADFEPRRWFRKVEVEVEEAPGGLASLSSIEEEEEIDQLPILEGALAPGWEVEDAVLCIGGRTPLDEAAGRMLAGSCSGRA